MRMDQAKSAFTNEPGQLQGRTRIEPIPHRHVHQRDRPVLSHGGEPAGLETRLGHVEPQRRQSPGQQVLHTFRPRVVLAVDDVQHGHGRRCSPVAVAVPLKEVAAGQGLRATGIRSRRRTPYYSVSYEWRVGECSKHLPSPSGRGAGGEGEAEEKYDPCSQHLPEFLSPPPSPRGRGELECRFSQITRGIPS